MDEESLLEIKNMARWLYKYNHICDMWDQKKIDAQLYAERMTNLEWRINSLVHSLRKSNVPVDVTFYRNMDPRRIQYFYDGKEVTNQVFESFFM